MIRRWWRRLRRILGLPVPTPAPRASAVELAQLGIGVESPLAGYDFPAADPRKFNGFTEVTGLKHGELLVIDDPYPPDDLPPYVSVLDDPALAEERRKLYRCMPPPTEVFQGPHHDGDLIDRSARRKKRSDPK